MNIYAPFHSLMRATAAFCAMATLLTNSISTHAQSATPPASTLRILGTNAQGARQIQLTGPWPRVYALEVSTNLSTWTRLTTNVLVADSMVLTDATSTNVSRRFYRAVQTLDPPYAPGRVVLQFKPTADATVRAQTLHQYGLQLQEVVQTPAMIQDHNEAVLVASFSGDVHDVVARLSREAGVEFAEPSWLYYFEAQSNDPLFLNGSLWGMCGDLSNPANAFGSQAAEAWATGATGSANVYVGVIDQGIQFLHPDLLPNIWTNPYEIPGNGIDDDGNGYIDDVQGWDFLHNDNSIYDGSPSDLARDAHGTHVAGTIGATGGNGQGVAGVNWSVKLISGKFLEQMGSLADAIRAVDYFTDLKQRHGLNIAALNNSWGGGGYSRALHEAIIRAAKANILFVAAAGNNYGQNNDRIPFYPANYDTRVGTATVPPASYNAVLSVAAIRSDGQLSAFSNIGSNSVHLGAPGEGVVSTVPLNNYASYNGTSMATPHVTGAAALLAASNPGAQPNQIRQALLTSAIPTPSLAGRTVTGGRLNVSGALAVVAPVCPGSDLFVDLAYTGASPDGTRTRPFPRVAQAIQALNNCPGVSTMHINTGIYVEPNLLFARPVLLVAENGPARIGSP